MPQVKTDKYQPLMGISYPGSTNKKFMNKSIRDNKKRTLLSVALILAASTAALAQGNGMAGITEATSMVTSYFDPAV